VFYGLPFLRGLDARRYAELVLASAQVLEAQGDTKAASEKYLAMRTLEVAEPASQRLVL